MVGSSDLYEKAKTYFLNGQIEEARNCIVNLSDSDHPDQLLIASQIYLSTNDHLRAEKTLLKLLPYADDNLEIKLALALTLKKVNKITESENLYSEIVEQYPSSFEAYYNYSILLYAIGKYQEAVNGFNKSISLNQNFDLGYYNLGNSYRMLKDYENAEIAFKKSIELNSQNSDAYYNLGVVLENQLKFKEALTQYEKAIDTDYNNVEAHWNKSILLLLLGYYEEGWKEYEWRLKKKEFSRLDLIGEKWQGEDLRGKRIYVYAEQGIGDLFQLLRYVKELKSKDAYVILECKEFLFPLLKKLEFIDELSSKEGSKPEYDFYISIFSLPQYFLTNTFSTTYLVTDKELNKKWQDYFSQFNEYKIGIVWQGNKNHKDDKIRSCPLTHFEKLLAVKNTKIFSIQKLDETDISKEYLTEKGIVNLDHDLLNTEAIINNLDLIITIDTSIAHLAGGLGKKVWLMLSAKPDWRWGLNTEETNWYPSVKLYRQQRLGNYERVFDNIIDDLTKQLDNTIAAAWEEYYRKGIEYYNSGNLKEAINYIKIASEKNRNDASLMSNLGLIYKSNNQFKMAEECFQKAIKVDHTYVKAYSNLAIIKADEQKYSEAKSILSEAIRINSEESELQYNLGIVYYKQNKNVEAINSFIKAIEKNAVYSEAYYNLTLVLLSEGRIKVAQEYVNQARDNKLDSAELDFIQGNIFKAVENFEEAIKYYTFSIEKDNGNIDTYINLASAYFLAGLFNEAITLYNELIKYNIADERVYYSLGVIYHEQGELRKASEIFSKALEINPTSYETHLGLAEIYLTEGKYIEGFREYEWRLKRPEYNSRIIKMPNSNEELKNKSVYVFSEQGFGDIINFSHYVNELENLGANVTFEARPELNELFSHNYKKVVSRKEESNYDFVMPLLSLPKFFLDQQNKVLYPKQNLIVKGDLLNQWNEEVGNQYSFKIGIVWKGKSYPVHNRKRHTELKKFKVFSQIENVKLYSLQIDGKEELIRNDWIIPISNEINSFKDTAAVMQSMDLVITIDTAAAHLAGAMGVKTWTLLAFMPDWRWKLDSSKTEWYPSMKLYRQKVRGDWDSVFQELYKDLVKIVLK